ELGIVSVARRRPHGLKIPALGGRERHEAGCVLERLGREARRLEGARSTATPPRACLVRVKERSCSTAIFLIAHQTAHIVCAGNRPGCIGLADAAVVLKA